MSADRKHQYKIPSHWLTKAVTNLGVDPFALARALGCTPNDFQGRDFALPLRQYYEVFNLSADMTGLEALGLLIADQVQAKDFGLLGYLIANAPDLGMALELLTRYHDLFSPQFGVQMSVEGDKAIVVYREADNPAPEAQLDTEFSMALFVKTLRESLSPEWKPSRCTFTYELSKPPPCYYEVFGNDLTFRHHQNSFEFPVALLATTRSEADPTLMQVLMAQADQALTAVERQDDLVLRAKLFLLAGLGETEMDNRQLAKQMNLSIRSLHRRLKEAGTHFKLLRDEVIASAAKEALISSNASISEIAITLGFSETSAFIRSFKRITGSSPLKFRKLKQEN